MNIYFRVLIVATIGTASCGKGREPQTAAVITEERESHDMVLRNCLKARGIFRPDQA